MIHDLSEKTLVVVTCIRDLDQLQIMFKSIERYLIPCKFVIVVNEDYREIVVWDRWYNINKHFLSNHQVQIFTREEVLSEQVEEWHIAQWEGDNKNVVWACKDGWISQNILKICIAEKITTPEYILLDSKNFFIKPTRLNDIQRHRKSNIFTSFNDIDGYSYTWGKDWILAIAGKLGKSITSTLNNEGKIELRGPGTPYSITTSHALSLLKYFGGVTEFNRWFLMTRLNIVTCFLTNHRSPDQGHPHLSEFVLYDLFCKLMLNVDESGKVSDNVWTLWSKKDAVNNCAIDDIPDFVHVAGIHRNYIAESSKQEIEDIYDYFGLMDRGLDGKASVC